MKASEHENQWAKPLLNTKETANEQRQAKAKQRQRKKGELRKQQQRKRWLEQGWGASTNPPYIALRWALQLLLPTVTSALRRIGSRATVTNHSMAHHGEQGLTQRVPGGGGKPPRESPHLNTSEKIEGHGLPALDHTLKGGTIGTHVHESRRLSTTQISKD